MKKCPFCAEEIQDEAIKCRYCNEFLAKTNELKWYFRTSLIIIAVLSIGPLALPLIWFHPRMSREKKIIFSVIIIALTYVLTSVCINSLKSISQYYRLLSQ